MRIALTIAGSDSGGGAGIQADLKTFQRFGVFGTSAITAITAQNTRGVSKWEAISADLVRAQIDSVADDLPPAAIKTGMLGNAAVAGTFGEIPDGDTWYGKVGLRERWTHLGHTIVFGEYAKYKDSVSDTFVQNGVSADTTVAVAAASASRWSAIAVSDASARSARDSAACARARAGSNCASASRARALCWSSHSTAEAPSTARIASGNSNPKSRRLKRTIPLQLLYPPLKRRVVKRLYVCCI